MSEKSRPAILILAAFLMFCPFTAAASGPYHFDDGNRVIGAVIHYKVEEDESLIEIARQFGLGYNEIVDANPGVDPFVPGTGRPVIIPTSWVLPDVRVEDGIVINLSEMRLYYFRGKGGQKTVVTFPIGIGSEGNDTPLGTFSVIEKIVSPVWHVPESIRKEKPELPNMVPPGPDNPLGSHALRLSVGGGTYLIHGTNKPWAVGRRATHGCIRLYPEDIPTFFEMVPSGTSVTIIRQPVKVAMFENRVYAEVHRDDYPDDLNYTKEAVLLMGKKSLLKFISTEKLFKALKDKSGIPVVISEDGVPSEKDKSDKNEEGPKSPVNF